MNEGRYTTIPPHSSESGDFEDETDDDDFLVPDVDDDDDEVKSANLYLTTTKINKQTNKQTDIHTDGQTISSANGIFTGKF